MAKRPGYVVVSALALSVMAGSSSLQAQKFDQAFRVDFRAGFNRRNFYQQSGYVQ